MPGVHSGIPGISDRYIQWYSRYQCQIHTKVSKVSVSGTHSGIQGISVRYTQWYSRYQCQVHCTVHGIQGISFKYTQWYSRYQFQVHTTDWCVRFQKVVNFHLFCLFSKFRSIKLFIQ